MLHLISSFTYTIDLNNRRGVVNKKWCRLRLTKTAIGYAFALIIKTMIYALMLENVQRMTISDRERKATGKQVLEGIIKIKREMD
jgi:hypothetical protein